MLEQIAKEMKDNALKKKLDIMKGVVPEMTETTKRVAVGDVLCHVMFTCDVFRDKSIWHLSLSTMPYGPVPEETAQRVRQAFFGEDEFIEMPSILHGKCMKQYLAKVKS